VGGFGRSLGSWADKQIPRAAPSANTPTPLKQALLKVRAMKCYPIELQKYLEEISFINNGDSFERAYGDIILSNFPNLEDF